jgi:hypothetical protein
MRRSPIGPGSIRLPRLAQRTAPRLRSRGIELRIDSIRPARRHGYQTEVRLDPLRGRNGQAIKLGLLTRADSLRRGGFAPTGARGFDGHRHAILAQAPRAKQLCNQHQHNHQCAKQQ